MKKIIRIKESDLEGIVRRFIPDEDKTAEMDSKINSMSDADKVQYGAEIKKYEELKKQREDLYKNHGLDIVALKYFQELVDDKKRRENPKIYLGVSKHHSTGLPFIIGRTAWKVGVNDYANLRVYVGKLSDFGGDKDSPEAMRIAMDKMRRKIAEKFPPPEMNMQLVQYIIQNKDRLLGGK